MAQVEVEEVAGRAAFRRFVELPWFLFREEPRWSPPLASVERARFERSANPALRDADYALLLARSEGRPAGRLAVRLDDDGAALDALEAVDDLDVVVALVEAAREWLDGADGADGTDDTDATDATDALGPEVLTKGFGAAGVTGRPWNPPWYVAHLLTAGLRPDSERATWRLPAQARSSPSPPPVGGRRPVTPAGRFTDARLVLPGIVAVPDLRGSTTELMRRARRATWDTAVVIEVEGDPAALVPQLVAAAADAGYRDVIAPWTPDPGAAPETVHTTFRLTRRG